MFNQVPSIHDSFNARTSTTKLLCENFIVNEYFTKIAGHNHSILIGPRGSGKTTLMKMLQVQSLELWEAPESAIYRSSIKYSGVFIPTDRLWKNQYDLIRKQGNFTKENNIYLDSIFIYHVLEKIISTLEFRANKFIKKKNNFLSINIEKNCEYDLVRQFSETWGLLPKTFTLKSLELEILEKKNNLSNLITNKSPQTVSVPENFRINQLVEILNHAITGINSFVEEKGNKWCLLFDELELAPEELIKPLIDSIRGGPEDIIFKLSMSPYHGDIKITNSPYSPMAGQDHTIISLSDTSTASGLEFSKKLCSQILKKRGFDKEIDNYFDAPQKMNRKVTFNELSKKDNSFTSYLKSNSIEIEKIDSYTEEDKLPTIRKVQFVVFLRNYYIKSSSNGKVSLKSRKSPPASYAGFESLCKAMEFNPRMLIGMSNMFLDVLSQGKDKLSISDQIKILESTYRSYSSLLNTISIDLPGFDTIFNLIEHLAKKCSASIKGNKFIPEPQGTFIFKIDPPENLKRAIGYALNSGALISEDSKRTYNDIIEMKNLKCRLSFLFSHHFGLLMTSPREIEFESVLHSRSDSQLGLI